MLEVWCLCNVIACFMGVYFLGYLVFAELVSVCCLCCVMFVFVANKFKFLSAVFLSCLKVLVCLMI